MEMPSPTHRNPFSLSLGIRAPWHKGHSLDGTADLGPGPELALVLSGTWLVPATPGLSLSVRHMTEPALVLSQVSLSIQGSGMRDKTAKCIASATVPINIFKTCQGYCGQNHADRKLAFTVHYLTCIFLVG